MPNARSRWAAALVLAWTGAAGEACSTTCKCGIPDPDSPRAVAADEQTVLGFSADDVVAQLTGRWTGTLAWIGDPAAVTAQPASGTTAVDIQLRSALDEQEALVYEPTSGSADAATPSSHLEVPAHLMISTADGALAEGQVVKIVTRTLSDGNATATFSPDQGTPVQGTYTASAVDPPDNAQTFSQLGLAITPAAATGTLSLRINGSMKGTGGTPDTRFTANFPLATFDAAAGPPDGSAGD